MFRRILFYAINCLSVVILCSISSGQASIYQDTSSSIIEASVVDVYDGDTITVRMYLLPGLEQVAHIRLLGIDTPELRGKCDKEKNLASRAKNYLADVLQGNGNKVFLRNIMNDKYGGRYDAEVYLSLGQDDLVNNRMVREGLAVSYWGDKKIKDWCE